MATFAAPTRKRATRMRELPGLIVSGQIPEDQLLGRYAFYSLPDEERSGALLMRSWVKHGLDENALPEARQPVHIFQSACASVKQRVGQDPKTGQRVEILANEVENNPRRCSYQITVRRWDLAQRVIEHEKGFRIEFEKRTNAMTTAQLEGFDPAMGRLMTAIEAHFIANASTVPGQKVRNAVRQTILDIGGQNLRRKSGGLYFIPRLRPGTDNPTLPTLEGLANVLEDLYDDRGDFHTLRAGNDEAEKEMIRKHFALNATEKAKELSDRAWTRVRAGRGQRGVRSDLTANLENERRALLGQIRHFEQLIDFERKDIEQSIVELDEALEKLDELANEPAPTP